MMGVTMMVEMTLDYPSRDSCLQHHANADEQFFLDLRFSSMEESSDDYSLTVSSLTCDPNAGHSVGGPVARNLRRMRDKSSHLHDRDKDLKAAFLDRTKGL